MRRSVLSCVFLVILFLTANQCKKGVNPIDQLPPISNTGANTFGCLVNERVMLPRDGTPTWTTPSGFKAVELMYGSQNDWIEFNIGNYQDGRPINSMMIHFQNLQQIKKGDYVWMHTTFEDAVTGFPVYYQNHIYCRAYNYDKKEWLWFGSYDNSGKVTITRYDTINPFIISGVFSGKLREKNGTNEITISLGRFDFGPKLYSTRFP